MSAPSLIFVFELESVPRVFSHAVDEGEERRLEDWIAARDDIAALRVHALTVAAERGKAA